MKMGSDFDGSFTFLDIISIASFIVGLENLNENLTQSDKQDLQDDLSKNMDRVLNEIHAHLEEQDNKIDKILEALYDKN